MAIDAWLTLAVLAVLVLVLVREMAPPAVSILGALVTLVLLDVVTPAQAFVGFSSTATITIAGLFVVAGALNEHAHIEALLGRVLGDGSDERASLARLVAPSAGLSAVMANTPLVAAFAPAVRTWAERNSRPASLYLIPLSFAAILGALHAHRYVHDAGRERSRRGVDGGSARLLRDHAARAADRGRRERAPGPARAASAP